VSGRFEQGFSSALSPKLPYCIAAKGFCQLPTKAVDNFVDSLPVRGLSLCPSNGFLGSRKKYAIFNQHKNNTLQKMADYLDTTHPLSRMVAGIVNYHRLSR